MLRRKRAWVSGQILRCQIPILTYFTMLITTQGENQRQLYIKYCTKLRLCHTLCDSTLRKGLVVSQDHNCCFLSFPKWLICQLNFWGKNFEIVHCGFFFFLFFLSFFLFFFRYGNFIDVITDWWKVDFQKKALKFGNLYKVLVVWQFSGPFYTSTLLLHQIL